MSRALGDVPRRSLYVKNKSGLNRNIYRLRDTEKQLGQKFGRRKTGRLGTNRSVVKAYE